MKWIEKDKYYIISGIWTIAKYYSATAVKYGLSKNNKNIGYFNTLEEAKKNCKD